MHIWRDWATKNFFKKIGANGSFSSPEWPIGGKNGRFWGVVYSIFWTNRKKFCDLRNVLPVILQTQNVLFHVKTQHVGVCSGSGTVLTIFGLTGCNLDKFFRLTVRDDVSMWHYCLDQARQLDIWKWQKPKNREISDFDKKPNFSETLAKLSRSPYPYGSKKCFLKTLSGKQFFKKNQVLRRS